MLIRQRKSWPFLEHSSFPLFLSHLAADSYRCSVITGIVCVCLCLNVCTCSCVYIHSMVCVCVCTVSCSEQHTHTRTCQSFSIAGALANRVVSRCATQTISRSVFGNPVFSCQNHCSVPAHPANPALSRDRQRCE